MVVRLDSGKKEETVSDKLITVVNGVRYRTEEAIALGVIADPKKAKQDAPEEAAAEKATTDQAAADAKAREAANKAAAPQTK